MEYTLSLIWNDRDILLGKKKRGFGAGWWNGFGGKLKAGEDVTACVKRELYEESGLRARKFIQVGDLDFQLAPDGFRPHVHVFRVLTYDGTPRETEEMKPHWHSLAQIPYEHMWPSDRVWLPIVLAGGSVRGEFHFTEDHQISYQHLEIKNKY